MDSSTKSMVWLIGFFVMFCLCAFAGIVGRSVIMAGGWAAYMANTNPVDQTNPGNPNQFVPFVQPRGIDPQRDLSYSETNKNNSEAYKNVQDGYSNRIVANGQADKLHAEACDIRNDCNNNGTLLLGYVIGGSVVMITLFFIATRKREKQ